MKVYIKLLIFVSITFLFVGNVLAMETAVRDAGEDSVFVIEDLQKTLVSIRFDIIFLDDRLKNYLRDANPIIENVVVGYVAKIKSLSELKGEIISELKGWKTMVMSPTSQDPVSEDEEKSSYSEEASDGNLSFSDRDYESGDEDYEDKEPEFSLFFDCLFVPFYDFYRRYINKDRFADI